VLKGTSRRGSHLGAPGPSEGGDKKLNVHALFTNKHQLSLHQQPALIGNQSAAPNLQGAPHERRQSLSHNGPNAFMAQTPSGMPAGLPFSMMGGTANMRLSNQPNGMPGQARYPAPGQSGQVPVGGQFGIVPPHMQQQAGFRQMPPQSPQAMMQGGSPVPQPRQNGMMPNNVNGMMGGPRPSSLMGQPFIPHGGYPGMTYPQQYFVSSTVNVQQFRLSLNTTSRGITRMNSSNMPWVILNGHQGNTRRLNKEV
jgi:hypothetical protein